MSPINIPDQKIRELKTFVDILKLHPEVLHDNRMGFFRDYLKSLNATIPGASSPSEDAGSRANEPKDEPTKMEEDKVEEEPEVGSEPESEVELDMSGVIEPDNDPPKSMGDPSKQDHTEEELEKFSDKQSQAFEAMGSGEWEKAIDFFTEAIEIDATKAAPFAKRGTCFLKLKKPNACIRDCTRALEINPDSAPAYKSRGRAYRLIGKFLESAKDLRQACKIDFDEQTDEWLKEVTPNAKKIEEHEIKKQRKKEEKELREKQERIRKAKEANERAAHSQSGTSGNGSEGLPDDLLSFLSDPEMKDVLQDPEVATAFMDISQNPANILKYQNNPKIMKLAAKLTQKVGGGGMPGMPGGFPGMGGMPGGFPGFPGGATPSGPTQSSGGSAPKPPSSTDDLD